MAEAVLFVELVPTSSGVKRGIEKDLNGTFDAADKKGTSVFSKIGGLAKGAAIAAGAAAAAITGLAIKGGFERMLKIEDAQAKLEGLGNSVESVDQIMNSALASVKGTAFGLDTAATVAASAVAAGIKPGQDLEKYLRLTADAATIAGISMDEMGSIMNKVQTNGRAMTENLNQLSDRGIPILQWLADEYGVTAAEMSKMVSQGKVDAETFNKVLQENIGGAALKSGETTRGAWANMLAALSRVGVALLENVFPYFKETFNGITVFLDDLTDRIGPFAEAFGEAFNVIKAGFTGNLMEDDSFLPLSLVERLMTFGEIARTVFDFLGGIDFSAFAELAGYFTPLGAAFQMLGPMLPQLVDPLMQIASVLAGFASGALPIVAQVFATLGEAIGGILVQALPVVSKLLGVIAGALEQVLPIVMQVANVFGDVLAVALEALTPILGVILELIDPLIGIFNALMPVILAVVQAVLPLVTTLVEALAPILVTIAQLAGDLLVPILGFLGEIITALTPIIVFLVEAAVNILNGALAFLIPIIEGVVNAIATVMMPIVTMLTDVLTGLIDFLVNVFTGNWEGAWQAVINIFGSIWDGLVGIVKGVINGIIDLVNGFLGGLSDMGGWLGDISGGTIGFEVGQIPRLEDGALVKARTGGIIANIGEGRYDEVVLPLSPDVLSQVGGGGGGSPIYVYPQPGQSEEEIGRAAARYNNSQLRRS